MCRQLSGLGTCHVCLGTCHLSGGGTVHLSPILGTYYLTGGGLGTNFSAQLACLRAATVPQLMRMMDPGYNLFGLDAALPFTPAPPGQGLGWLAMAAVDGITVSQPLLEALHDRRGNPDAPALLLQGTAAEIDLSPDPRLVNLNALQVGVWLRSELLPGFGQAAYNSSFALYSRYATDRRSASLPVYALTADTGAFPVHEQVARGWWLILHVPVAGG